MAASECKSVCGHISSIRSGARVEHIAMPTQVSSSFCSGVRLAAAKFKRVATLHEEHMSPASSTDQINSRSVVQRVLSECFLLLPLSFHYHRHNTPLLHTSF
uniref:Uncharacterized protein n=1 Tax=Rhipicephalus zambeziensis TaxID=60191 RepID=A0A224Y8T3_9ACAR